jgi:hypothetical protein
VVPVVAALLALDARSVALLLGIVLTLLVLGSALRLGSAAHRRRRSRLW